MKSVFSAVLLFLTSLPAIAATEVNTAEAAVEPLGTFYVVCMGLVFIGLLVGFYLYYMRWNDEEDKSD
jgi:NhaP-type Na+/H+ or K+/H+ antiporter